MNGPFYAPGRYRCEVVQQGIGEAKTGTPQFVLKFRVLEFENGEPVHSQYERTSFNSITDKTMEYFVKKLAAIGFERESLKYLDPAYTGYQSFVGNIVVMFCIHDKDSQTNESREKWDIAYINSSEPLELKPVDSGKLRQLDVLFGAASKTKKPAPKPQPIAVMAGDQPSDDDVPF
jgi:hypothetical protein